MRLPTLPRRIARFGTFALVFGICFAVLYVICDMAALPMFTYHPGTGRIDSGFAPRAPRRRPGDVLVRLDRQFCARRVDSSACSPPCCRKKSAAKFRWRWRGIVPVALLPVLIYSLKFYWRWE